jgi:acyl-coenzyme A thioesterase PaaI-like protein
MKAKAFKWLVNVYPPFLGAGIRVRSVSPDFRKIEVEMPLRWYNRNYVGTHFGGSLYSMVDPFYMVMLMHVLGPDYIVWDKAAAIEFFKPGTGTMRAGFHLTEADLESIYANTAEGRKYLPEFSVEIVDAKGELVARVRKTLYIRRKPRGRASAEAY